jgi:hypothetical protein
VSLLVRYVPVPDRVRMFAVWLIDGAAQRWLVGWVRDADDSWIARRRDDGEPVHGFPRRRDAAMYLACCGWCQPKPHRGAR